MLNFEHEFLQGQKNLVTVTLIAPMDIHWVPDIWSTVGAAKN